VAAIYRIGAIFVIGRNSWMSTTVPLAEERLTPEARRSVIGGILSLFVDSFDIYLPALVLPAVMDYFEPASMSATTKVTLVTVIFVVTLLGRPIGGPIFGNLADRIGRRRVTMITGIGFTIVTLLIGLMPGYASWGYGSIVGLILLRLIGGIFLGGGYAGPVPLAIERSPMRRRGLVGGVMAAGAPAAITLISIIQLVVLERFSGPALQSWGWRIPFFFGFLLGIAYVVYYSRVEEVDLEELKKSREGNRAPIFQLFNRSNIRGFGQVFLLMTGMWFAAQIVLPNAPLGCLVVYLNERFGAGVRSSGYGTVYTLSLILPALYSVWITVLQAVLPYEYTAVVLIVLGGVLFFAGAWIGPETRGTVLLGEPAGAAAPHADAASE
jgi:MFS family permease